MRGYSIDDLVRNTTFGDVVFMLLTGELPRGREGRLVEAMLVACCEHSLASPSVDAVRFVASSGVPLQTAVAAGVSAIGEHHGGAIEPCAILLKAAVEQDKQASEIFRDLKAARRRLPGYGHPVHQDDPRVKVLLELADEWQMSGVHTALARELEAESDTALGRHLQMNVDGAIAALMCDIGIDPVLGKAFFIVGRAPGYIAHAHEQMQERPFKAAAHDEITYSGPANRTVSETREDQG